MRPTTQGARLATGAPQSGMRTGVPPGTAGRQAAYGQSLNVDVIVSCLRRCNACFFLNHVKRNLLWFLGFGQAGDRAGYDGNEYWKSRAGEVGAGPFLLFGLVSNKGKCFLNSIEKNLGLIPLFHNNRLVKSPQKSTP